MYIYTKLNYTFEVNETICPSLSIRLPIYLSICLFIYLSIQSSIKGISDNSVVKYSEALPKTKQLPYFHHLAKASLLARSRPPAASWDLRFRAQPFQTRSAPTWTPNVCRITASRQLLGHSILHSLKVQVGPSIVFGFQKPYPQSMVRP